MVNISGISLVDVVMGRGGLVVVLVVGRDHSVGFNGVVTTVQTPQQRDGS